MLIGVAILRDFFNNYDGMVYVKSVFFLFLNNQSTAENIYKEKDTIKLNELKEKKFFFVLTSHKKYPAKLCLYGFYIQY